MTFPQTPPGDVGATLKAATRNQGNAHCSECMTLSHRINNERDALRDTVDSLRDRVAELEAKLGIVTGATATVNQHAFIKRITDLEAAARKTVHWMQRDLAAVVDERDDLRRACERAGVNTAHIRQHFVGKRLCCSHGDHVGICNAILPGEAAWAAPSNCQCEGTVSE